MDAFAATAGELTSNEEPLDRPRDISLAQAVVRRSALTTARDGSHLQIDLLLVMTSLDFEQVWARRRSFLVGANELPVADLADIVAAKAAAGRPKDRLFLATHAAELRRLLGG